MQMSKSLKKTLAENVSRLMLFNGMADSRERLTTKALAELCAKNGNKIDQKTIWNVVNPEKSGSVTTETIESIAKVFGIEAYHLLIPDLSIDELTSLRVEKLLENYAQSAQAGRENIARIAENEARYNYEYSKIINEG